MSYNSEKIAQELSKVSTEEWNAILQLAQKMIEVSSNERRMESISKINSQYDEENLNLNIVRLLKKVGIPPHFSGYEYLEEAVRMCYKDNTYLKGITRRLYPEIARKFDTTKSRVERAIRHSVEYAFENGSMEMNKEIFTTIPNSKGKPTNSNVIATLVEYLKINNK